MTKPLSEDTYARAIGRGAYGIRTLQRRPPGNGAQFDIKMCADDELVSGILVPFVFEIPWDLDGFALTRVRIYVTTVASDELEVSITNLNGTIAMLATDLTIDSGELSSRSAATPAVIATTPDDLVADGDQIQVAIVSGGTDAMGLGAILEFAGVI